MRAKRDRPIIAAEDVAVIFDDVQVVQLAKTKLPPGADMAALAKGVREAARIFVREAGTPTGNLLHKEIAKLHKVATATDCPRYDEVAALMESMSPQALDMLKDRGAQPTIGIDLPPPDALRDPRSARARAK